jgi:hypothetical protein
MKKLLIPFFLAALANGLPADFDNATEVGEAKQAIAAFAGALKSELLAAMQSGGAVNAIEVCNSSALSIAETVSLEKGMKLSRTSLKYRNPANAPGDWQAAVLESFEGRKKQGETPDTLTWHEVAVTDNGREFRFMKAIPAGGLCLQCHGQSIAPDVREKLSGLYPEDKATGYREGDIRGAFVVTRQSIP